MGPSTAACEPPGQLPGVLHQAREGDPNCHLGAFWRWSSRQDSTGCLRILRGPPSSASFTLSPFALGLPFSTQIPRSLAAFRRPAHRGEPAPSQGVLSIHVFWEKQKCGEVGLSRFVFFPSYGHCQPVRTFGQRQKMLLLISEGDLIFLEDLAGPPIAGGVGGQHGVQAPWVWHSENVACQPWGWGCCSSSVVSG